MHYKVYTTPEFDRLFRELPKDDQAEIDKLTKKELPENPYQGRSLGFKFFREKRIRVEEYIF